MLGLLNGLDLHNLPLKTKYHRPSSEPWLDVTISNDMSKVNRFGHTLISVMSYQDQDVELNLRFKKRLTRSKGFQNYWMKKHFLIKTK